MARGNTFLSRWSRLYSRPTAPELAMEPAVAALGVPYRFQHPIFARGVIPDFALFPDGYPVPGVIFEVDGDSHRSPAARRKDAERTAKLEADGWTVVRCENDEAVSDPRATVARMWAEAQEKRRARTV